MIEIIRRIQYGSLHRLLEKWYAAVVDVPESVAWIVFSAVIANMAAFVLLYSNAVIISDAWYFLDVFIRKALDGTLRFSDFFVYRRGLDHAQPLRKFILLLDLRYFHLDFRYEALAGLAAAGLSLLLLRRMVFWRESHHTAAHGPRVWIWAATCAVLISLNSFGVWTWPLVASGFTSYVFMFVFLLTLWHWLAGGKVFPLMVSALALNFVADDTAMLINLASLITLALLVWLQPAMRRRAISGALMLILALVVTRLAYAWIYEPPAGESIQLGSRLGHLWTNFLTGGWWQWVLVPLGSSVTFILPLQWIIGDHALLVQACIGVLLLFAHLWFWWRVLWQRPRMNAPTFSAIALMLVFYALLAGIVFGRVSLFGNSYLNQPRYVLVYSFNAVALLLMLAGCEQVDKGSHRVWGTGIALGAMLLLAWQIPLSFIAWNIGPCMNVYQQKFAWQIGQMAAHPDNIPEDCAPELVVCSWLPSKRKELVHLLQAHRLNVFSPQFQRATGLDPNRPPSE